jgi:hypothetical protein
MYVRGISVQGIAMVWSQLVSLVSLGELFAPCTLSAGHSLLHDFESAMYIQEQVGHGASLYQQLT